MSILPSRSEVAAGESAAVEFELKLSGPLPALEAAFAAADGTASPTVRRLRSHYFDTADRRLAARGLTFRLRDLGDRWVQTVKADARAPERLELEAEVDAMQPDLAPLRRGPLREALGALFPEELELCFTTDVERRTRRLCRGDDLGRTGEVELAFDRGLLLLPDGRSEPLAELEVEAKSGDRQAVFVVAKQLAEHGATRLVVRSKAARGHDLAAFRPPAASKAAGVRLARDLPLGRALGLMLASCSAQIWANHDAAFDGHNVEGVHQLRVGLRRLRSVLTLFHAYLAPARRHWLQTEAKAAMAALGSARDLDVFVADLLPPVAAARPNDAAIGALRVAAEEARSGAYDTVRATLESERYTRFLLDLGAWIDRRGWLGDADHALHDRLDTPVGHVADRLLARRAKVVRKRGRDFERLDAPDRHEVRIALKKLRYAVDFTRGVYPAKRVKPYLRELARLQDAFGHLNDQAQAEALLDRLATGDDPRLREARGLVLGWYAHAALDANAALVDDWNAFRNVRPFWEEAAPC